METRIIIPKNHPESEQLEKVTKSLLEFLPLQSMYIAVVDQDSKPKTILTLLLSDKCEMDVSDLRPFVQRLFRSYPQFQCMLFEKRWAVDMWEEGSPFLILHAMPEQLAYISDKDNKMFFVNRSKIKEQIRGAEAYYKLLNAWADNSLYYVTWYNRYGDYLQAAFHLHQALKHKFEVAAWLLMGEYLASESLKEHQQYIISFDALLGKLFDPENKDEKKAIKELDNSCRAVRYNYKNYTFTKETVELAITKVDEISARIHKLFKTRMAKCKVNLVSNI